MAVCKKCGTILNRGETVCPICKERVRRNDTNDILQSLFKSEDYTGAYSHTDINDNKLLAVLCYIPFVCLFPAIVYSKSSAFVRFHANQGIIVFALHIIIGFLSSLTFVFGIIPFFGFIIKFLVGLIFSCLELANLAAMLFGIINAATGKAKEIPIIGKIRLFK